MSRVWRQLAVCVVVTSCCGWYGCGGAGLTSLVNDTSLADVAVGGGADATSGQPVPGSTGLIAGAARARVRNESVSRQVDVTVRFIRDDVVVRLAFVRVAPETATTVLSPQAVDTVELSGVDSDGSALTGAALLFGRDFDVNHPAEYIIFDDRVETGAPEMDVSVDDVQIRPVPVVSSTIQLLEPSTDKAVLVGSTVTVRWTDFSGSVGSVVRLFLRKVDTDELVSAGPAVNASLDGINDELRVVLGGIAPGEYEVLAEIDDGRELITSVAPGRLTVVKPVVGQNTPPTLSILTPVASPSPMVLTPGSSFEVSWKDDDPDDNATIVFTLEPSDPAQVDLGVFQVSPPFAEDFDGPAFDRATLSVSGVLPGVYDLVGSISDGSLADVSRVERAIMVREQLDVPNDPPTLLLEEPSADVEVPIGGSFFVRWLDGDRDHNARISLFLDPDTGAVARDGDEILLINSISEDVDGAGDEVWLGLSADISPGEYSLVAVISDGTAEMESRAPGIVVVIEVDDGRRGGGSNPPGDEEESDPPNGHPPAGQTITMLDPLFDVNDLTASTVALAIPFSGAVMVSDVPDRVTLTNEPYGGTTTVEFAPAQWLWQAQNDLRVAFPRDLVPNAAWPRSFEVRIRLVDASSGSANELVSPNPLWLPQEVELVDAAAVSYSCDPSGLLTQENARFVGLAIDWFGGGFREDTPGAEVAFWLSSDGVVPAGEREDATHRLVWRSAGSPHVMRTAHLSIDVLRSGVLGGLESVDTAPSEAGRLADLDPGSYHLLAVVNLDDGGRLVTRSYPTTVAICVSAGSSD